MKLFKRIFPGIIIMLLVLAIAGCGGGSPKTGPAPGDPADPTDPPVSNPTRYVYTANHGSNNISIFKINYTTGALEKVGDCATGTGPQFVTVHPNGRYLYTGGDNNAINFFQINQADGTLSPALGYSAGTKPIDAVFTKDGKYLYVVSMNSKNLSAYSVDPLSGELTALVTLPTGNSPKRVVIHPNGQYLYVALNGADVTGDNGTIQIYSINQNDGTLSLIKSVETGKQPDGLAFNPGGTLLVSENFTSKGLKVFSVNTATGDLVDCGDVETDRWFSGVGISPDGKFVFAPLNVGVMAFSVNGTQLTTVAGSPFDTDEGSAQGAVVDPTGQYLYIPRSYVQGRVSVYVINSGTGALTLVGDYNTDGSALALAIR